MELEKLVASSINKPKRKWNIINNEIGNTKNLMDNIEIKYGSDLPTSPQLVADKFNSHFIYIIAELKLRIKPSNLDHDLRSHNFNSIYLASVTEYEVECTIRKKNSYSMGYDEFPEIVIKHCGQYLIKPLLYIFNLSV
jgi:hypothetical protein